MKSLEKQQQVKNMKTYKELKKDVNEAVGGFGSHYSRSEKEAEQGDDDGRRSSYRPQPNSPHAVHINGKKWKTFGSKSHAMNVAKKIKGATVVKEEVEELDESLSHDYILQSLADKDINAHVKNGKVIVHPDDATEARKHLKKIGHDHLKVTIKGAHQVAEEVEELDEIKLATVGKIIKHSPKIASIAIGAAVAAHSAEPPKQPEQPVKTTYSQFVKKVQKEEVEVLDELKTGTLLRYATKAKKSALSSAIAASRARDMGDDDEWAKQKNKEEKRDRGVSLAHSKLRKEEVELDEILDPSMGAGEYVKDFQKSDAPQFKGKSQEKRRIMGIAAYMAAKREKNK